jgi:hypothetical protein
VLNIDPSANLLILAKVGVCIATNTPDKKNALLRVNRAHQGSHQQSLSYVFCGHSYLLTSLLLSIIQLIVHFHRTLGQE